MTEYEPEISKQLVVGTCNIREGTAEWLTREATTGRPGTTLTVYAKGDYGWFINVPERRLLGEHLDDTDIPGELFGLFWMAIAQGCHRVEIDRDAGDTNLPQWDW
ncbi:MAG: hypothetical protein DI640_13100 [Sphingomonas taxi]|uniref:DUF5983 domain-containing protein n=1 Tax=Sphingomonas taxi TaxID=1549858 RepID=A0A2W5AMI6_9SPHN|nr:MAG: hypothetical protein DI640_13100 [Sphingomonas taxi]